MGDERRQNAGLFGFGEARGYPSIDRVYLFEMWALMAGGFNGISE